MFEVEFFIFLPCWWIATWPEIDPTPPLHPPVLAHVSMLMGRLLTWASLLLRGFPEDLRLLAAQRPQASQLLRQLRVGQRQVHPVGRRGRGPRPVKHFIAAWAQSLVFSHGVFYRWKWIRGPHWARRYPPRSNWRDLRLLFREDEANGVRWLIPGASEGFFIFLECRLQCWSV